MSKGTQSSLPKYDEQIKALKVCLVDNNGKTIGILKTDEALNRAREAMLNLVEIVPNSDPPVCKILDFGKYKYEYKKRSRDLKKKQKIVVLKEVKFKPNIGENDFNVKLRKIKNFLAEGDKVKVSLLFKGREITHTEIGMKILKRILNDLDENIKVELAPKIEGNLALMILAPLSNKTAK